MKKQQLKEEIKNFTNMKDYLLKNKKRYIEIYGKNFVEKELKNYDRIINTNIMVLCYQ